MRRHSRRSAVGFACSLLVLGCAQPDRAGSAATAQPAGPTSPASLAVDVYGGAGAGSAAPADAASAATSVEFHLIEHGDPEHVLASGRTGHGPVEVPGGVFTLVVQLDPVERIGPFRLEPGAAARVRILDTLDAALPSRIWRIERGDEVVGRAFPPPDQLPARSAP